MWGWPYDSKSEQSWAILAHKLQDLEWPGRRSDLFYCYKLQCFENVILPGESLKLYYLFLYIAISFTSGQPGSFIFSKSWKQILSLDENWSLFPNHHNKKKKRCTSKWWERQNTSTHHPWFPPEHKPAAPPFSINSRLKKSSAGFTVKITALLAIQPSAQTTLPSVDKYRMKVKLALNFK